MGAHRWVRLGFVGAGCDERDDVKRRRRQKRVCSTLSVGTTRRAVAATMVADSAAARAGTWRGVHEERQQEPVEAAAVLAL